MKSFANIIWLVFGGALIAVEYVISSVAMMVTIVGIPFGLQTLKLAALTLWPFGSEVSNRNNNMGCLSTIMNLIWFFVGGFWIAITHLAFGILFAITIIGLPFAVQHFKLAGLALTPFGRDIV